MVQVLPIYVPTDGVALTSVYPDGKASATETPVAIFGPAFVAVTVKVTFVPTFGVLLLTVFTTPKLVI